MTNRMPWKRELGQVEVNAPPQGWSTFRLRCPMCMRLTKDGVIAECDAGFQLLVQERVPGAPGFSYYYWDMNWWELRKAKEWMVARLEDAIERVNSS